MQIYKYDMSYLHRHITIKHVRMPICKQPNTSLFSNLGAIK